MVDILSRNYWRRMWIVQELALNQNMTMFLCGDQQFPRVVIWSAAEFCRNYEGEIRKALTKSPSDTLDAVENNVVDLWQLGYDVFTLFTICEFPDTPILDIVLDLARKSKVKNARDKIYGILGLLPDSMVAKNQPDYSLSPPRVYLQFAKSLLDDRDTVNTLLSWCSFNPSSLEPSWVPDWTQQFPRNHLQWLRLREASKQLPASLSTSADGRTLICKGILVDVVESTSSSPSKNLRFRTQVSEVTKRGTDSVEFGRYCNENGLRTALQRTLLQAHPGMRKEGNVLDIYWIDWNDIRNVERDNVQLSDLWYGMRNITAKELGRSFDAWEAFDRFRHTNADYKIFGHCFRDFFPNMREYVRPMLFWKPPTLWDYPNRPDHNYYLRDLTEDDARNMSLSALSLISRRLVTTSTGYLGLAPEEAHNGDKVGVLYGCNFPVVLRPAGDSFQYIGECYIDGLMDGEAIDAQERGGYEAVDVRIC
jgi:hypothetical protein